MVRKRDVDRDGETPPSFGVVVPFMTGGGVWGNAEGDGLDTGNGKACIALVGEGAGAPDRGCGPIAFPFTMPLGEADELPASSPTRLLLVSIFTSPSPGWDLRTILSGVDRGGPNAGD